MSADFMNNPGERGLFTDRYRSNGEEVVHEVVVDYYE